MKRLFACILALLVALFPGRDAAAFAPRRVDAINIMMLQRATMTLEDGKLKLTGAGSAYVGPWDGTVGSGTNDYPLSLTVADPDRSRLKSCRDAISGNIAKNYAVMLSGPGTYTGGPSDEKDRQKPLTITIDKIELCDIDMLPGAAMSQYMTPDTMAPFEIPEREPMPTRSRLADIERTTVDMINAFDNNPVVVTLYFAGAAMLLLLPLVPAIAMARRMRRRTLQHPHIKAASVLCLLCAIGAVVEGMHGGGKEDDVWFAVAPSFIAAAPFFWLDRLDKRHRAALACLGAAVCGLLLLLSPLGGLAALLILPAVVISAIAAVVPPYTEQGGCDVLSRTAAFLACMAVFGFFVVVGLWQMVAAVTR